MIIKLLIIGAGKGGLALIEFFQTDPSIEIVAVVDTNPHAIGLIQAQKSGIPVYHRIESFFNQDKLTLLDLIIEVTGQQKASEEIRRLKSPSTRMISGIAARFIWQLLEERTNSTFLEERYNAIRGSAPSSDSDILFGSSPIMKNVQTMIRQVAATDSTVLLIGETGTGKELIAQSIFQNSKKTSNPFIKVNCTAFTPEIIESELFGHVKGSFTGAISNKMGILEKADGGTLFLDEIGDIPLHMQVKLLRYLQFGEVRPVGSNEVKNVKTRIIAATNRNLEELIEKELFRKDLYYRLNTFTIEIPPLRERKQDIPLYAYHFLKKAMLKLNKKVDKISSNALDHLISYEWPGNLRELQGVIERAIILTHTNTVQSTQLPNFMQPTININYNTGFKAIKAKNVDEFEQKALRYYINEAQGNVTKAALLAKLPRKSFYRLMHKHQINTKTLVSQ